MRVCGSAMMSNAATRLECTTDEGRDMTQRKNAVPHATVPGPTSLALFTAEQEFLAPGIQRISLLSRLAMSHGTGAQLFDVDGNRYLDFYAGVTVASLGHAHPRLIAALETQLRKLMIGSF